MWNGLFLHHYTVNFVTVFWKACSEEKEIRSIPVSLSPGFWGLRPHGFFHFHFFHHCIGFLAVSSNDWKPSLSRYCFSVLRWVCSSMLQCLRTGTLWPSITGKLNCSPMPRCHRVNQPLFFPIPNSWTLVLQIKGDSWLDRALIDLPLPRALRAKWPSTCKSAEIWSFG